MSQNSSIQMLKELEFVQETAAHNVDSIMIIIILQLSDDKSPDILYLLGEKHSVRTNFFRWQKILPNHAMNPTVYKTKT